MNEKLDTLLASSSQSSTSAYSDTAIKALVATLVQQHEASIEKATKAVNASTKRATETVEKLILDAKMLLESVQALSQQNANLVNATIDKITSTLHAE